MNIRKLGNDEIELLKDFLYEAVFVPEGMEPPDRSIIKKPELAVYYEGFGRNPADYCLVAEEDGTIAEICVRNGQVVEYGTVLFRLGEEK